MACVRRGATARETGGEPFDQLQRLPVPLDADAGQIGRRVENLRVAMLSGNAATLDDLLRGRRGLVVAMASAECPISRKYAPRIAAIEREFGSRFAFLHVNAVEGETTRAIRDYLREFDIRGDTCRDDDGSVRRELRPRTTTEVFVLDGDRRVVYRGAIDDQYRFGGTAPEPKARYLRDALTAVGEGRTPAVRMTGAPGCLVDPPPAAQGAGAAGSGSMPFYPGVADVLARHCVGCHHPGGPGAFSLATHADVRGRTAMIAAVVREGVMPPNHGERSAGTPDGLRSRRLSDQDRRVLLGWIDSSQEVGERPEEPRTPPAATTGTWTIGTPDLILFTVGPTVSPGDAPTFGRSLVPVDIDRDRWVEAVECRPMKRDSIEVADVWILPPGAALPGPGEWPRGAELFATYSRSDAVVRYGDGAARRLAKGSRLVADILARPMARPMESQLRIALKFTDAPRREIRTIMLAPGVLRINAGESGARASAEVTLGPGARLVALEPLMGPRGREMTIDLASPGVPPSRLLDLGKFDWRWRIRYPLERAMDVPAGSRLLVSARFDNSATNPANPDATATPTLGVGPGREFFAVAAEVEVGDAR